MHNASCDGGHSAELLIKSAHSTSMRLGTCQLRKRVRFMIQNSNKKVLFFSSISTVLENQQKLSYMNFSLLEFFTNFRPIKIDCLTTSLNETFSVIFKHCDMWSLDRFSSISSSNREVAFKPWSVDLWAFEAAFFAYLGPVTSHYGSRGCLEDFRHPAPRWLQRLCSRKKSFII